MSRGPGRIVLAAAVLAVLPATAGRAQAQPAKKHALLIGLNTYLFDPVTPIPGLEFAEDDAEDMGAALSALGYETQVLTKNGAELSDILRALAGYAQSLGPEHEFVLFFAGHGMQTSLGRDVWLTYDASPNFPDENGIRLEHLLDYVHDIKAENKLVILDHCYSGKAADLLARGRAPDLTVAPAASPTPGGVSGRAPDLAIPGGRGIADVAEIEGTFGSQLKSRAKGLVVLAAARDAAFESTKLGHGLLTAAVLDALKTQAASDDETLTALELVTFVSQRFEKLARKIVPEREPQMVPYVEGVIDWDIGRPPPGDRQATEEENERYLDELIRFYERGWGFEPRVYGQCEEVLEKRVRSLEPEGPKLETLEKQIVNEIRKHLDSPEGCEERCAKHLDRVLRRKIGE